MPNVEIRGCEKETAETLKHKIDFCMQEAGLGTEGITDIVFSKAESCDGKRSPMPYLRLFSSEVKYVLLVLASFEAGNVHQDVEVIADKMMFFTAEQVGSGEWRSIFASKMEIDVRNVY